MKLYSLPHSPYAARIRMQIYSKQLAIDILPPEIPLKTAEFKAAFPLGKVPLLVISAELSLPESTAIAEYLEDAYPAMACRPVVAESLAITRATVSYANSHFGPSLFPLFKNIGDKDAPIDKHSITAPLCTELEKLNRWLSLHKTGGFDIGDFALASNIWYATTLAPLYGVADILADYPQVESWWELIKRDPHVAAVLAEMGAGFSAFMQKNKK